MISELGVWSLTHYGRLLIEHVEIDYYIAITTTGKQYHMKFNHSFPAIMVPVLAMYGYWQWGIVVHGGTLVFKNIRTPHQVPQLKVNHMANTHRGDDNRMRSEKKKWLTFWRQHFQTNFVEWKVLYFDWDWNLFMKVQLTMTQYWLS